MTTTIHTASSVAESVVGSGFQRKLDRCQDGTLWRVTDHSSASIDLYYSKDNGATWTQGATFGTGAAGADAQRSMFIDRDDFLHLTYVFSGNLYYRRGTPNAGRTDWTFGPEQTLDTAGAALPTVVAHPEGTGWAAHVAYRDGDTPKWIRVAIAADGTHAVQAAVTIEAFFSSSGSVSVEFAHNGDGKTPQASPHLFFVYARQGGDGLQFKKATYSGGSWTLGAARVLSTGNVAGGKTYSTGFDGSRVIVAFAAAASAIVAFVERDAADTTTTARTLPALSDGNVENVGVSWDGNGNAYVFASAATSRDAKWVKFTRSGATWGAWTTIEAGTVNTGTLSTKRGYQPGNAIEATWIDGTANPYSVKYDLTVPLNSPPNAPLLTAPADGSTIDRSSTQRFDWDFSDPDAGDSQSAYNLRYRLIGAGTWTETGWLANPSTFHDFAGGTFAAGDYEWQAATKDAQGVEGPFSGSSFFTAATAPPQPTITDPINGETIGLPDETITWSAPDQSAYQQRRVADNAGTADTSTVYQDTGEVTSASARSRSVTFATNNRYEHIQVRIKLNGLWSSWASIRVNVSYTPPPIPGVNLATSGTGIVVTVFNPTPGAGEPAVTHNEVYVDDGAGETRRVAQLVPNGSWTYHTPRSGRDYAGSVRVVAVGDNGTRSSS